VRDNHALSIKKEDWRVIGISVLIGSLAYGIKVATSSPFVDPLLLAMVIGIATRTIGSSWLTGVGYSVAPRILIPLGIVFYGLKNLNFVKIAHTEKSALILVIVIMLVYYGVIFYLGNLFKQRKQIIYLTATGSAICGASAIVMTSPAVEAEPDDVSVSLLSVALAAFLGLFIFLPFFALLFGLPGEIYALLSGSVLQFTGFVKAAMQNIPYLKSNFSEKELTSLALSIKAIRYMGLLVAIPLFGSLIRRKFYFPGFLWAFLGAGILGSWIYSVHLTFYSQTLTPLIAPIYNISWSIAMAAVGLNADIRQLFSYHGTKALMMAFGGFMGAVATFFIVAYSLHLLN